MVAVAGSIGSIGTLLYSSEKCSKTLFCSQLVNNSPDTLTLWSLWFLVNLTSMMVTKTRRMEKSSRARNPSKEPVVMVMILVEYEDWNCSFDGKGS